MITGAARGAELVLTRVLSSAAGLGWLFSVLVTGGLIGLGAPFWFKTFKFVASFVPGIKSPDSTAARQPRGPATSDSGSDDAGFDMGADGVWQAPRQDEQLGLSLPTQEQPPATAAAASKEAAGRAGLSDRDLFAAFRNSRR